MNSGKTVLIALGCIAVPSCTHAPEALIGHYRLSDARKAHASLSIKDRTSFRFCADVCQDGSYTLYSQERGGGRIRFNSPLMEAFANTLLKDAIGEKAGQEAVGPPQGFFETNYDVTLSRVTIEMEGTRAVEFVKDAPAP